MPVWTAHSPDTLNINTEIERRFVRNKESKQLKWVETGSFKVWIFDFIFFSGISSKSVP